MTLRVLLLFSSLLMVTSVFPYDKEYKKELAKTLLWLTDKSSIEELNNSIMRDPELRFRAVSIEEYWMCEAHNARHQLIFDNRFEPWKSKNLGRLDTADKKLKKVIYSKADEKILVLTNTNIIEKLNTCHEDRNKILKNFDRFEKYLFTEGDKDPKSKKLLDYLKQRRASSIKKKTRPPNIKTAPYNLPSTVFKKTPVLPRKKSALINTDINPMSRINELQ